MITSKPSCEIDTIGVYSPAISALKKPASVIPSEVKSKTLAPTTVNSLPSTINVFSIAMFSVEASCSTL